MLIIILPCRHDVPDQQLERDFDVSVDLDMSSVIYTHTKRFPIEIINFLQDFLDYHDNIGHMRAASSGQQVVVLACNLFYFPLFSSRDCSLYTQ